MSQLLPVALRGLQTKALDTLERLVTPEGIYASEAIGWNGPYHAWFGRDGAITADFIFAALEYGGSRELAVTAWDALKHYARWQGIEDRPARGEERGKIPHEIRTEFDDVHAVQHAAYTNKLPWYIDPADNTLKNWDTADGTALWVLAVLRGSQALGVPIDATTDEHLRRALKWILRTLDRYDGLLGFTGADQTPERTHSGLHNQGWKDSEAVYQTTTGDNAPHPIKDVLVNAEAWAALHEGAGYVAGHDAVFSASLAQAAAQLKERFGSEFIATGGEAVLAQAIDGDGNKLEQSSVDQGAVLWARTSDGQLCIDEPMIQRIVEAMLSPALFNPEAGIRNYALGTVFSHGTRYHGSPYTYWPFMSGMVARGMERAGYTEAGERVMQAMLHAIRVLGTNIEMFIQNKHDEFEPWSHPDPDVGQMSSREQAWTAAAVYYASSYMLAREK